MQGLLHHGSLLVGSWNQHCTNQAEKLCLYDDWTSLGKDCTNLTPMSAIYLCSRISLMHPGMRWSNQSAPWEGWQVDSIWVSCIMEISREAFTRLQYVGWVCCTNKLFQQCVYPLGRLSGYLVELVASINVVEQWVKPWAGGQVHRLSLKLHLGYKPVIRCSKWLTGSHVEPVNASCWDVYNDCKIHIELMADPTNMSTCQVVSTCQLIKGVDTLAMAEILIQFLPHGTNFLNGWQLMVNCAFHPNIVPM